MLRPSVLALIVLIAMAGSPATAVQGQTPSGKAAAPVRVRVQTEIG